MAISKQTPMMRQYLHLKQQYKDTILLFRMGDFYETFGKDAEATSKALNIALTTRDKNEDPTPLAGFPHHAIDQYLPKLVRAGYRVAIADQMEDPKLAKGIVRRDVTRVVTPGTLTDYRGDGEKRNTYLAAVFNQKKQYGLAVCDLSTGEFRVTEVGSFKTLVNELSRIQPSEILVPTNQDFSPLSYYSLQPQEDYKFTKEEAQEVLTNQFNVKSLAPFGIQNYKLAIIAAGAIINYLHNTQKTDLSHIRKIQYYDVKGNMILDISTIRNLDIIDSKGELGEKASLVSILDRTQTSMGARMIRRWILNPLLDKEKIISRQNAVEVLFSNAVLLSNIQSLLKKVADLERIGGKLGLNRANARDLINLEESLENVIKIAEQLDDKNLKTFKESISKEKAELQRVIATINKSIKENPPLLITEGDIIKDGYDKEIDKVRSESSGSRDWIKQLEKTEKERTGITSLKVRFNKVFGYYIEVTNTHKHKVPDNYIRKQTLVNCERYITDELKKKEELVLNAQEILAKLEYECFQKVREEILHSISAVQNVAEVISQLDALSSFADTARLNDYIRPTIYAMGENSHTIKIKNGRHPIVEQNSDQEFVSNDLEMDDENNRLIILTGPNMSGKSTYIRQVALLILMAQIGSYIPASSAEISIADRIFTRVGASDDLSAGRSTFMVEMDEAANIINNATEHSLIVLDEVGRGTSTYDGVSIAWAIAEHIHDKIKARCLFATHYHELLKLESELGAAQNYNVAVLEENESIIFLRKIEKGGTDKSYGIYVAQMAGLPSDLILRAQEILKGFEQEDMFAVRSEPKKQNPKNKIQKEEETNEDPQDQLTFIGDQTADFPNIFTELKNIDPDKISPIEALEIIAKWKKRVGK